MLYAKSTGGFYDRNIHGNAVPADAVDITAQEHAALLAGQSEGKRIVADENGCPILAEPMPPTREQSVAALTAAVQAHLDNTARGFGYDDIKSAVTYADEPAVPKFQDEGRALRAWRSQVWAACYARLSENEAEVPTAEQVIAALPAFELPVT